MERVHYRRVTQPGGGDPPARGDLESNPREKMIVQGIVSGVILAAVIFARLADTDLTADIRRRVDTALSGQTNLEQLTEGVQNFSLDWLNWEAEPAAGTADGAFNNIPAPAPNSTETLPSSDNGDIFNTNPASIPSAGKPPAGETAGEFYIDEDILAELNALTADTHPEEASKSPVPGPSAAPGP